MTTFRFLPREPIPAGVRRIAHGLTTEALGFLDDPAEDEIEEAVHEVRKLCKKLRGLVRLVRPALGDAYDAANTAYRDAARKLSAIRDAHALLETFDTLVAVRSGAVADEGVRAARAGLARRSERATEAVASDVEHLAAARELLEGVRADIDGWPLDDDVAVLVGGVETTYRRGRARWRSSWSDPTDEQLHQWRKRVKYSWNHLRLVRDAAPSVLSPLIGRFHDLSDLLGDDHDLAVLTGQLYSEPDTFGGDAVVHRVVELVTPARADLQDRAHRLGARLYVEPAGRFAERIGAYWEAWAEHGDERAAGELDDVHEPDDDLDERSLRQLRVMARELDIPGRSAMERDVLVATIRATGEQPT